MPYALYGEGPSLEDCDLITTSMPLSLARKSHIILTEEARRLDTELLDGLARVGLKLDSVRTGQGGGSNTSPEVAAIISMSAVPI